MNIELLEKFIFSTEAKSGTGGDIVINAGIGGTANQQALEKMADLKRQVEETRIKQEILKAYQTLAKSELSIEKIGEIIEQTRREILAKEILEK